MTGMVTIDETALRRYEGLAARRPRWYRVRLTAAAILGDVLLTAAQIAPVVLPIAVGVLFYPHPWLLAAAGLAIVFFVWMTRPQLRVEGRALGREEAPALFDAMDDMCRRLQVHGRIEICLDDSFNAGAGEGRGLFGLLGTRRVMSVGMPFLAWLSKSDVLAVVAHELGHFSGRHGLLANWLYRARMGWAEQAVLADRETSPLERATSWYAKRFAPTFLTLSLVHSRGCEYEADRDAADVVGADAFARALTRVAVLGEWGQVEMARILARWRRDLPEPPADYHARMRDELGTALQRHRDDWIAAAMAMPTGWHDTHPSLADRLRAVGGSAAIGDPVRPAGEELLGADWVRLLAEFDAKWRDAHQPSWRLEHAAHALVWNGLIGAGAERSAWPADTQLMRARALRISDPATGMAELRVLHEAHPDDVRIGFAYAAALLHDDHAGGVDMMIGLAQRDAALSEGGYARLLRHAERHADNEGVRRWGRRRALAARSLDVAGMRAMEAVRRGEGEAPTLPSLAQSYLESVLRADPAVRGAWLADRDEEITDGRSLAGRARFHVLVLRLDTAVLRDCGDAEDRACGRYCDALSALLPANEFVLAIGNLTTEPVPRFVAAYTVLGPCEELRVPPAPAG